MEVDYIGPLNGGYMVQKMTTKDLRFAPDPGIYCPKCEKTKAAYEFALNKRSKTGRQGYCRRCYAAYRLLKEEKPEPKKAKKAKPVPVRFFKCTSCGDAKTANHFHKRSDAKFGIQSMCKACKKTYDKNRLDAMKGPKPGTIVEVPVPERLNWVERIARFFFGPWFK